MFQNLSKFYNFIDEKSKLLKNFKILDFTVFYFINNLTKNFFDYTSLLSCMSSPRPLRNPHESLSRTKLDLLQQTQQKPQTHVPQQSQHYYESINEFDQFYFDVSSNAQILSTERLYYPPHMQTSSEQESSCCTCTLMSRLNQHQMHAVTCGNLSEPNANQNRPTLYFKSMIV